MPLLFVKSENILFHITENKINIYAFLISKDGERKNNFLHLLSYSSEVNLVRSVTCILGCTSEEYAFRTECITLFV